MTDASNPGGQVAPVAGGQASGSLTAPAPGPEGARGGGPTQSADRFSMAVPSGWVILPLDPATRDRRIAGMVKHRIGKEDRHAYLRRQYVLKIRKVVAEAANNGAFFLAVHSGAIKGVPMMASVIVSMLPQVSDAAGNVLTDPAALAADAATGRGEASKGETLEHSVVELQVGSAARIHRRAPIGIKAEDGREVIGETIHYYVPLPEARRTLAMVFSTPLLSVADAYTRLFDVMALSARWKQATEKEQAGMAQTGGEAEGRPKHAPQTVAEAEPEAGTEEVRPKHARIVPEEASR